MIDDEILIRMMLYQLRIKDSWGLAKGTGKLERSYLWSKNKILREYSLTMSTDENTHSKQDPKHN